MAAKQPLETTVHPLIVMAQWDTPYQTRLHHPFAAERERTLAALHKSVEHIHYLDQTPQDVIVHKLITKLCECGRHSCMYQAGNDGRLLISTARCKSRICPRCSAIRAIRARESIAEAAKELDSPRFITLTPNHCDDPLADQIKSIKTAYTRLRRSKGWKQHVTGAICVMEVKWSVRDTRWHPHLHIIADGTYWPQHRLSQAWQVASDGAKIVDIRVIRSRAEVARYVSKYVTDTGKNGNIPFEKIPEYAAAMHGVRLINTCGKMHNRVKESPPKVDRGIVERVEGFRSLADAATSGNKTATRLMRAVKLAARLPADPVTGLLTKRDKNRSGKIARRVRRWWPLFQAEGNRDDPQQPRGQPVVPRARDGTERLWQEPEFTPDALLHGA